MTLRPLWTRLKPTCLVLACVVAATAALTLVRPPAAPVLAADKAGDAATASWDRQAAARYLDDREVWWQTWDRTQKDHGTYCISCHT